MSRYSVRRYYTYVDEYVVEAENEQEADEKVDDALNTLGVLVGDNEYGVTQTAENEYVDYDNTMVTEIDADGAWIGDPVEM